MPSTKPSKKPERARRRAAEGVPGKPAGTPAKQLELFTPILFEEFPEAPDQYTTKGIVAGGPVAEDASAINLPHSRADSSSSTGSK